MAEATTTDATSTDTTEIDTTTETETETQDLGDGGKAALAAERKARRDAEKQAKAATAELQKLQEANMNEVDRAIAQAKLEGRTEALREAGLSRVEDAMRAAATGRNTDVDALLETLDLTKFLDENGTPERDAIQAYIDRVAPAVSEEPLGFPNLEQGPRTAASTDAVLGSTELEKSLKSKLGIR